MQWQLTIQINVFKMFSCRDRDTVDAKRSQKRQPLLVFSKCEKYYLISKFSYMIYLIYSA